MEKSSKKQDVVEFDAEIEKIDKNEAILTEEDVDDEYEEIALEDRIINIEKKTNSIMALVIILIALVVINLIVTITRTTIDTKSNDNEATSSYNYDVSSFEKIKATDIASVSKGKQVVIWMGRQGCSFCSMFAPILESAQEEYGFKAYYLDLYDIIDEATGKITDQNAYEILMSLGVDKNCQSRAQDDSGSISCEDFMERDFGATPLTIFVKDGKMTGNIGGYVQDLGSILEEQGFSK